MYLKNDTLELALIYEKISKGDPVDIYTKDDNEYRAIGTLENPEDLNKIKSYIHRANIDEYVNEVIEYTGLDGDLDNQTRHIIVSTFEEAGFDLESMTQFRDAVISGNMADFFLRNVENGGSIDSVDVLSLLKKSFKEERINSSHINFDILWQNLNNISIFINGRGVGKGEIGLIILFGGEKAPVGDVRVKDIDFEVKGSGARLGAPNKTFSGEVLYQGAAEVIKSQLEISDDLLDGYFGLAGETEINGSTINDTFSRMIEGGSGAVNQNNLFYLLKAPFDMPEIEVSPQLLTEIFLNLLPGNDPKVISTMNRHRSSIQSYFADQFSNFRESRNFRPRFYPAVYRAPFLAAYIISYHAMEHFDYLTIVGSRSTELLMIDCRNIDFNSLAQDLMDLIDIKRIEFNAAIEPGRGWGSLGFR